MRRTPALLLLLVATALPGCGRTPDTVPLLVGGWAPPGSSCDSAGGVVYDKTGAWAGYDVSGRYRLKGDRLTTWVTERGGYDQPARKVSGEKPSKATVLSLTQTELTLRRDDGSTLTLKRCRP